jgi:hypothetical protein
MAECPNARNYQTKPKNPFESMLALFGTTNEAKNGGGVRRWVNNGVVRADN